MKKVPDRDSKKQPFPAVVYALSVVAVVVFFLGELWRHSSKEKSKHEEKNEVVSGRLQSEIAAAMGVNSVSTQNADHFRLSPAEVINSVSTGLLVVVTIVYVVLTYNLSQTSRQQLMLAQEPTISISPGTIVEGETGHFTLSLINAGLSGVRNIDVFEDYFVALKQVDLPLTLYRFGLLSVLPDTTIPKLGAGERVNFQLEFADIYPQMMEFYNSDVKGSRMLVVRLLFRYYRGLDGREFQFSKLYTIAAPGDVLLDDSTRFSGVGPLTLDEVEATIGNR